jgi:acetylornithine deacetylase
MEESLAALLSRLIAFDTTSSRSNLECLDWIAEYAHRFDPAVRFTYNDERTKANLLLSFGPNVPGGVVLSAHTDTVPVEGQSWSSPPFTATVRDGKVYGRGTSDMKGFIAACLAAIPHWQQQGLQRPIHLALSYDEELGCVGVPRLIADFADHVPSPALVWVGEPTSMRIATAHKGVCVYRTEFYGKDAHSSVPHLGRSAIADAVRFAQFLLSLGMEAAERRTRVAGLLPAHTTFNIGRIDGGAALNMVARSCCLEWEFRSIPEEDVAGLRSRIDEFLAGYAAGDPAIESPGGAVLHDSNVIVPPLRPDGTGEAVRLLRQLVGDKPEIAVPFGTEAGLFQSRGWPTVVCGPGSIDQAHRPDEWIEIGQLNECLWALRQLPAFLGSGA